MTSFPSNALWDLSLPPTLPALGDDEFIALLQKQFGVPTDILKDHPNGSGIVNPQNLTRYSLPSAITPPSEDSSPSPDTTDTVRSRRHSSGHHTRSVSREHDDDPALKRKASDEDLDDEPSHKSQHTRTSSTLSPFSQQHQLTSTDSWLNSRFVLEEILVLQTEIDREPSCGESPFSLPFVNTVGIHTSFAPSPPRQPSPLQDESRLLKRKEQNRAAQRAFRERKEKHVKDVRRTSISPYLIIYIYFFFLF